VDSGTLRIFRKMNIEDRFPSSNGHVDTAVAWKIKLWLTLSVPQKIHSWHSIILAILNSILICFYIFSKNSLTSKTFTVLNPVYLRFIRTFFPVFFRCPFNHPIIHSKIVSIIFITAISYIYLSSNSIDLILWLTIK